MPPDTVATNDLVQRLEKLHVPVISDSLDRLGVRGNVLAPHIRPLQRESRVAGTAATVQAIAVETTPEDPVETYAGIARAVETLRPGDVIVVSTCHHGSYWGELIATAASLRGAVGVVADAYARDTRALELLGFPTFVAGINAQDSVGRMDVASVGEEVECAGVVVRRGDLVLADNDGVVIVPIEVAEEAISEAEAKFATEGELRARLQEGMPITEAVATYGVL